MRIFRRSFVDFVKQETNKLPLVQRKKRPFLSFDYRLIITVLMLCSLASVKILVLPTTTTPTSPPTTATTTTATATTVVGVF